MLAPGQVWDPENTARLSREVLRIGPRYSGGTAGIFYRVLGTDETDYWCHFSGWSKWAATNRCSISCKRRKYLPA
jgi:hypothetical protein